MNATYGNLAIKRVEGKNNKVVRFENNRAHSMVESDYSEVVETLSNLKGSRAFANRFDAIKAAVAVAGMVCCLFTAMVLVTIL